MKKQKQNAITLIALIVTIVVLLILAGITINAITGENSLINKAKMAKNESNKSDAKQLLQLKITGIQMDEYGKNQEMPDLEKLGNALGEDEQITYVTAKSKKLGSENNVCDIVDWTNVSVIYTKLKDYDYEFGINDSLQIASIDGVSVITNTAKVSDTGLTDEQFNALKQEILSSEDLKSNMYPVGSMYESTNNTSPEELFGGTWETVYADYDYIYTGSQVLYQSWSTSTATSKTAIVGAYNSVILDGIKSAGRSVPSGYTLKIGCTAQFTTSNDNIGKVYLNSKLMCSAGTWSEERFRQVPVSQLYTLSEIGEEVAVGGSGGKGINLYVENNKAGYCAIREITVHGYFVSNDKHYKWKKVSD